jgi:predicted phage-related endonuclease
MDTGLSEQDLIDRKNFIGGSDANTIMTGTAREVQERIEIKRGERPNRNLDHVLPVRIGIATEELNRTWFTERTGRPVCHPGERRYHPIYDWMANTLDGETTTQSGYDAIFEAKHTSERSTMSQLVERYYPQLIHSMAVSSLSWAVLSVFFGNSTWEVAEVEFDPHYAERMIEREKLFWRCRMTGDPWPELPPGPRPDIESILKMSKPLDMSQHNEWAILAPQWRRLKSASRDFKDVSDRLKELVNPEVRRSYGRGVIASVDKRGIVSLSEDPDWVEQEDLLVLDDDEPAYCEQTDKRE